MSRGFSTLEILLALTIMTTTLTAIVIIELEGPSALAEGARRNEAVNAASLLLDTAFEEGATDFGAVNSIASTSTNGMTASLTVTLLPDGFTKDLTSLAAWTDSAGRERSVTLHAFVSDFADAIQNPCSDVLGGDWTHPEEQASAFTSGNLLPTDSAAAAVSVLAVSTSTLVAGIGTTTAKSDPTLLIFSISSTTRPAYLGGIDNATSTRQGVNAVALSDDFLFSASANPSNFATCKTGPSCSQLQIFDIHDPAIPVAITNFRLATVSAPFATGSGGQSIGKSIAYANGYIYLGLTKTGNADGEEFNAIDVHDPRTPVWEGGFSVGRSINQIRIHGTRAYLATDDPSRELIVLDIHDPSHIALVGSYDAPGAAGFGYGKALDIEQGTLALGRTYSPNGPGLSLLSVASDTPQPISSEAISSTLNPISVQDVLMRDFLLFVLTSSALWIFDLHDPTRPLSYGDSISLPSGSAGTAMSCVDNTIYVSSIGSNQTGYLSVLTGS